MSDNIHDRRLMRPGDWYACEHPERPTDLRVWWERECRSCILALGAAVRTDPSMVVVNETTHEELSIAVFYERFREEHSLPSLDVVRA